MNATIRLGLSSVLLMCAGGLAAYAPAASAQVAPLKNTGNGRCLATNAANGAVLTQSCNGAAINPYIWNQINISPGFFQIRNTVTLRCLDNNTSGGVFTSACNTANPNQRWMRQNTTPTTARFKSLGTARYLESTATGAVVSNSVPGGNPQIWAF